jgi:hypothetical protein
VKSALAMVMALVASTAAVAGGPVFGLYDVAPNNRSQQICVEGTCYLPESPAVTVVSAPMAPVVVQQSPAPQVSCATVTAVPMSVTAVPVAVEMCATCGRTTSVRPRHVWWLGKRFGRQAPARAWRVAARRARVLR